MEFFANGFVDDLIAELTRFQSLRVLASPSAFGLSHTDRSVDDVVGPWDLQYVLDGSVRARWLDDSRGCATDSHGRPGDCVGRTL